MKRAVIFLVLIGLCGCATTRTSEETITAVKSQLPTDQKQAWVLMTGKWFGSQLTKDGGFREELIERSQKGTYKITFRFHGESGRLDGSTEVGEWGIAGGIYFTLFRGWVVGDSFTPSDPSDPYNYDAYRIITLTNEEFEYESLSSGDRYTLKRVPEDFVFPQK